MSLTDEQIEARKGRLFATDIARIMTGGALRVALEKMGQIPDSGEALEDVEEIELGHLLEPRILDAYQEKYPDKLVRSPGTMIHPEHDWLGCHLDGVGIELGGMIDVECKSVGWYNRKYWGEGGDEIPNKVLWQVIAQMTAARFQGQQLYLARVPVCFLDSSAFIAYILNKPLPITIFEVRADLELERYILNQVRNIWEQMQKGILPEPTNNEEAKIVYSKDDGQIIEADEEILNTLNELVDIRSQIKNLEGAKDRCEFLIKSFMKEAAILRYDNYTVGTWKNDADGLKFDEKEFAKDNPDDYKLYLKPKTGVRKFLPKDKVIKERISDS